MSVQSNTQTHTHFSITHIWSIFPDAFSVAQEWRARSAMRKTLGRATDRQLRDVGLIRQDVEEACDLPLTTSAESVIRTTARIRGANW
jgi:uncharacterized protein YjiS (DUF1127 family)